MGGDGNAEDGGSDMGEESAGAGGPGMGGESADAGGPGMGGDGSVENGGSDMGEESADAGGPGMGGDGNAENGGSDMGGENAGAGGPGMGGDGSAENGGSDMDGDLSDDGSGSLAEEENTPESGAASETEDSLSADEEEAETSMVEDRLNQEHIILSMEDVEDIEAFVQGITGVTISYSSRGSVEGGELTSAQNYTVAGVPESYAEVSKLTMAEGYFISDEDSSQKSRVCVLGSSAAAEIFGSAAAAKDGTIYIDDRTYTVIGVLSQSGTVASGISVDTTVFVPYETGIKYITGESVDPVITVIAGDVNVLDEVISSTRAVLERNYANARFTFEDSGSKMQAAESSNQILTMLLSAMAAIVFLVGGIGIMNVLFVSVKERTNEIGILKAVGTPKSDILLEFLIESAAISLIGGGLGVLISFIVIPVVERFGVRVEADVSACLIALGFAVLTGTIFGIYPAWKASRLEPVEALNAE